MSDNDFLQQFMEKNEMLNQGEMAFNPLKFFGGEPVKQRDMIDEGTLEKDEIDTGSSVSDMILRRRLEQKRMMEQLGL
tara:strand:- start:478 stop:711 length:234 start_codon:yes stop_codon:yes gene_type:complete